METCDQNAVDGFSFSQDLTSGLSQMYSQGLSQMYSQMTTQSTDSGFYGDSQSFGGMGAVPPQKRHFVDQMVPPSFPEVKKAKYNLPKWTKGLLKTAEETQKLKSHDVLLRRQEEENGQLRFFVQDVQRSIGSIPESLAQMIKESTDYVVKSFEKRNANFKMELLKDLNDALEKEMSSLKKQHLDNVFDTWNYLSEIKISLGEIQNSLDNQSNQSDVLKDKIENCCDSIVKAQQKMEEESSKKIGILDEKNQGYRNSLQEKKQNFRQIGNKVENKQNFRENVRNFRQIEMENKKDSLDESDDEFQVSVLRSRRKSKFLDSKKKSRSDLPALPKPNWTSTPIHAPMPSFNNRQRKLVEDEEMYGVLFNVEPEPWVQN